MYGSSEIRSWKFLAFGNLFFNKIDFPAATDGQQLWLWHIAHKPSDNTLETKTSTLPIWCSCFHYAIMHCIAFLVILLYVPCGPSVCLWVCFWFLFVFPDATSPLILIGCPALQSLQPGYKKGSPISLWLHLIHSLHEGFVMWTEWSRERDALSVLSQHLYQVGLYRTANLELRSLFSEENHHTHTCTHAHQEPHYLGIFLPVHHLFPTIKYFLPFTEWKSGLVLYDVRLQRTRMLSGGCEVVSAVNQ